MPGTNLRIDEYNTVPDEAIFSSPCLTLQPTSVTKYRRNGLHCLHGQSMENRLPRGFCVLPPPQQS